VHVIKNDIIDNSEEAVSLLANIIRVQSVVKGSDVNDKLVAFAKAGANIITFHPEASDHVDRSLQLIRDHGCKAGLVFNPATPLSYLEHVMDKIDIILIMSVNPGFGGQKFIPSSLHKIERARAILDRAGSKAHLQVDGGVIAENAGACLSAGADALVAGSFVFKGDYAANIAALKSAPNASTAG
jgi:ribulose-phosphate 3-epimerase